MLAAVWVGVAATGRGFTGLAPVGLMLRDGTGDADTGTATVAPPPAAQPASTESSSKPLQSEMRIM